MVAAFFSGCSGNTDVTRGAGALSATTKRLEPALSTVEQGELHGSVVGGVAQFLGVPYARPPARFEAPQPPVGWAGRRNATRLKERCAQMMGSADGSGMVGSEDCLYLNVFTSAVALAAVAQVNEQQLRVDKARMAMKRTEEQHREKLRNASDTRDKNAARGRSRSLSVDTTSPFQRAVEAIEREIAFSRAPDLVLALEHERQKLRKEEHQARSEHPPTALPEATPGHTRPVRSLTGTPPFDARSLRCGSGARSCRCWCC